MNSKSDYNVSEIIRNQERELNTLSNFLVENDKYILWQIIQDKINELREICEHGQDRALTLLPIVVELEKELLTIKSLDKNV